MDGDGEATDPLVAFLEGLASLPRADALFVLGNEAGDMDSCVSAVAYALLRRADGAVPVCNIPRGELRLRGEAAHVLPDPALLVFRDDDGGLPAAPQTAGQRVALVDHNELAISQRAAWSARVTAIVDHHKDEGRHADASPRIVREVGSCCSLLVVELFDRAALSSSPLLARMLLDVILLDTHNMSPQTRKGTPTDARALDVLVDALGWAPDTRSVRLEERFRALRAWRADVSMLCSRELLVKDAKFARGLAVSSASRPLAEWRERDPGLDAAVAAFANEMAARVCVVMIAFTAADGAFRRQLGVWARDGDERRRVVDALRAGVGLVGEDGEHDGGVAWFEQRDVTKSRKQVMPLVVQAMRGGDDEGKEEDERSKM